MVIIFSNFISLYIILEKFGLTTSKAVVDIYYKTYLLNILYKQPQELLNDVRLRILGNYEILGKC